MHYHHMEIRVFLISGGEEASRSAYEKLAHLIEAHDVFLTAYRGHNTHDGTWSLVLIGDKTAFSRYHEQIQHLLSDVQAQPLFVPPERLIPLITQFLAAQAEMHRKGMTFMKKHYGKQDETGEPAEFSREV